MIAGASPVQHMAKYEKMLTHGGNDLVPIIGLIFGWSHTKLTVGILDANINSANLRRGIISQPKICALTKGEKTPASQTFTQAMGSADHLPTS